MRVLAERERLNVGLAAPDRDEMVYLESIRYARRVAFRTVVSGQRIPMELTSLGRAYLASVAEDERESLMGIFSQRRRGQWAALKSEIDLAVRRVRDDGWCAAAWQPEVVAVAAPVATRDAILVLNLSLSTTDPLETVARRLAPKLLALRDETLMALDRLADERVP